MEISGLSVGSPFCPGIPTVSSWRGLRSTRALGSGLECLALWASLSCAASVAGPSASHTTAGSIPGDASGGNDKGLSEAEARESLL